MSSFRAIKRVVKVTMIANASADAQSTISFEGFDIDFKVETNVKEKLSKADIIIYNLPSDYRGAFKRGSKQMTLTAGYKNVNEALIDTFDIQRVSSQLEGPDWVTQIQCSGALAAWRDAQINSSFPVGVDRATVYRQIANALSEFGVGPGNFDRTMGAVTTKFPNGLCLSGKAMDVLERYATTEKFFFSVQNGQMLFIDKDADGNDATSGDITLSPDTGLIGLPEFSDADPTSKKKPQIKCRSLLRPEAKAGNSVVIKLPPGQGFITGRVRVNKVTHNGSTYAQPFYTDFECEAVT